MAEVRRARGVHFRGIGKMDGRGRMGLVVEEALYMVERGVLDCRWEGQEEEVEGEEEEREEQGGLPMSLQGAYATMLGVDGLTMERFQVYSQLKRSGFIVVRAPEWHSKADPESTGSPLSLSVRRPYAQNTTIAAWLFSLIQRSAPSDTLLQSRFYRTYSSAYRDLALIPFFDPRTPEPAPVPSESPLTVTYHVYKSTPTFRKSNPGPPDFRICVVSTVDQTSVPSLADLNALMESIPPHPDPIQPLNSRKPSSSSSTTSPAKSQPGPETKPRVDLPTIDWLCPPKDKREVFRRIRTGYRNVILAIVDKGIVSYLRLGEAVMGSCPLYEFNDPSNIVQGGNKGKPGSQRKPVIKNKKG